jgi:hypothetical protein
MQFLRRNWYYINAEAARHLLKAEQPNFREADEALHDVWAVGNRH